MAASAYVYIVFWISISCTMILFNKAVLDQMKFPFPMFLTTWHMVFATCCTQLMSRTTNMLPGVREKKVDSKALQTSIFPVALCFAFSLVLSNKSYIYLSVSYIQVRLPCYLIVLHSLLQNYMHTFCPSFLFSPLSLICLSFVLYSHHRC